MTSDRNLRRSGRSFQDPRGGHSRLYWEVIDSNAWRALSFSAIAIYIALHRRLGKTSNGNISATLQTLKHHGISSSATLAKGLRELRAVGLIEQTRQGGLTAGGKECSLYRFTDHPVLEFPKQGIKALGATNEWRSFSTIAAAKSAIDSAHAAARRPVRRSKVMGRVQNLNHHASETEA